MNNFYYFIACNFDSTEEVWTICNTYSAFKGIILFIHKVFNRKLVWIITLNIIFLVELIQVKLKLCLMQLQAIHLFNSFDLFRCQNYYMVLQVASNASVQEIETSYRKIVLRVHPGIL